MQDRGRNARVSWATIILVFSDCPVLRPTLVACCDPPVCNWSIKADKSGDASIVQASPAYGDITARNSNAEIARLQRRNLPDCAISALLHLHAIEFRKRNSERLIYILQMQFLATQCLTPSLSAITRTMPVFFGGSSLLQRSHGFPFPPQSRDLLLAAELSSHASRASSTSGSCWGARPPRVYSPPLISSYQRTWSCLRC